MRLAMRISAVDPDKARTEFLEGLENEFGVFEAEDERVAVSTKSGFTNPLGELNLVWNETYMSASMESILTGYDDPRLKVYFETLYRQSVCKSTAVSVRGRALRTIIMQAYPNCPSTRDGCPIDEFRGNLVPACRSCFARMDTGDEEECYQNGIKASLSSTRNLSGGRLSEQRADSCRFSNTRPRK